MPTVTCQHTKIEFEARTKTTKNHPRVAAALEEARRADKRGAAASRLNETLHHWRTVGHVPTIEEFESAAQAAISGAAAATAARWDPASRWERRDAEKARLSRSEREAEEEWDDEVRMAGWSPAPSRGPVGEMVPGGEEALAERGL